MSLDLDRARETFESSTDFTIGLEEEFAILDPATLELAHRFEDVYEACQRDEVLAESAAGELIASEIEIRSGRAESFAEAMALQQQRRRRSSCRATASAKFSPRPERISISEAISSPAAASASTSSRWQAA